MKAILNLCCAASAACVIAFAAGFVEPSSNAVVRKTDGNGSRTLVNQGIGFGSHARSKVVQYFDTYRTDPLGLPAACAQQIKQREVPASWTSDEIRSGMVVKEGERPALVEAPAELVRVLPARQTSVRYFLAGINLVAVDDGYKVVDSVRIPTVRLSERGALQLVGHVGG
ncbi:MAG: hypothetical protein V4584_18280 [Verrucomicrobiota bacterium]